MKKSMLCRLTTLGFCVALMTLAFATQAIAQSGNSNVDVSFLPVRNFATGAKIPSSGASLSRRKDGVFFTLHTQGLPPGHVVSAWLAVFNNPQFCATNPCTPADFNNPHVDGTPMNNGAQIIGTDGAATYGAYREIGDATGARPGVGTGNGIVDARRAEIHLVLRSHGLASSDPLVLAEQLTMFNGGCPPNTCVNIQASVFQR